MTKFQQTFEEMVTKNRNLFEEFKLVHDRFVADQKGVKAEFDEKGKPVLRIIEIYENRLCEKMENSGKGKFSWTVAEKFREEVKKYLPLIDLVGLQVIN